MKLRRWVWLTTAILLIVLTVSACSKKVPPPPPPPPEPPKKVKREPKPPEPPKAPIPNETPKEPPKEPAKPVFGVSMSSTTTGDSSFAVPVGNTTITDPKNTGRPHDVRPLPPPPPASAPAPMFKPASPLEVKDYPEVDEASCTPPSRYFPEDLRDQGVEGETQLRVEISEAGKVMGVRVLGGPHKTLNDLAAQWMKTRCRFPKPARNTAGKPVPFVITYRFKWEIER